MDAPHETSLQFPTKKSVFCLCLYSLCFDTLALDVLLISYGYLKNNGVLLGAIMMTENEFLGDLGNGNKNKISIRKSAHIIGWFDRCSKLLSKYVGK